ncbi:MAG: hypothetical protein IJ334_07305, partial [Clostridia bacterium]|nr:hypothetical protein [Clostridia bacterium]
MRPVHQKTVHEFAGTSETLLTVAVEFSYIIYSLFNIISYLSRRRFRLSLILAAGASGYCRFEYLDAGINFLISDGQRG